MKRRRQLFIVAATLLFIFMVVLGGTMVKNNMLQGTDQSGEQVDLIQLPTPAGESQVSVEQALWERRSVRSFSSIPLSLEQVSQLLWAAQGISDEAGHRTAPSAGALYPLEVYLVAGNADGLVPGVYHYLPVEHALNRVSVGDKRSDLVEAALNQEWIADAPGVIVIAGVFSRTNVKYGERTTRYVYMEAGAAAQNVYLQAESLGLGTVFVGAFYELMVQSALELTEEEIPLVIMPVGNKAH